MIRRMAFLVGAAVLIAVPAIMSRPALSAENGSDVRTLSVANLGTRNMNTATGESVFFTLSPDRCLGHVVLIDKVGDSALVIPAERLKTAIAKRYKHSLPALQPIGLELSKASPDVMFWNDYHAFTFAVRGYDPARGTRDPALYFMTFSTKGTPVSIMRVSKWDDAYPGYIESALDEETNVELTQAAGKWPEWLKVTPTEIRFTRSGKVLPYYPPNDKLYDDLWETYHELVCLGDNSILAVIEHKSYVYLESESSDWFGVVFYDADGRIIGKPEESWSGDIAFSSDGELFCCYDISDTYDFFLETLYFCKPDGTMVHRMGRDQVQQAFEMAFGKAGDFFELACASRSDGRGSTAISFVPDTETLAVLTQPTRAGGSSSETYVFLLSKTGSCVGFRLIPSKKGQGELQWPEIFKQLSGLH